MLLSKRNDSFEWELFDSCPKDMFREFLAAIFHKLIETSNIKIYIWRKRLQKKFWFSIRSSFGYLPKQPAIKSVFLPEKHLWFNFYESGPTFTFQYVFLNPFQDNFLFQYHLKGTIQYYVTLNLFFSLTHLYVTLRNNRLTLSIYVM